MNEEYKIQSQKVADYYNQKQQGYNEIYGDTIQAFRPKSKDELINYISTSACIRDDLKIIDAGCGVGGPAIWLAENFNINVYGVTVSNVQVEQANQVLKQKRLKGKVQVMLGDYHELETLFQENDFDLVLFLESLGHSGDVFKAIASAFQILKPGGGIYIKDFYYKTPIDPYWLSRVEDTIANINRLYAYKTLSLTDTLNALRGVGFEIDFIKKFSFVDDISIREAFEKKFGINIFDGQTEFYPAEWLEIKCTKKTP